MKEAVLFLRGVYRARNISFYKRLCRGRFKVAVDGGYSFFRKAGLVPDLLIGDLDSFRGSRSSLPPRTRVLLYPHEKDKTDAELALDYCLGRRARQIDIVQPSAGEPDHYVGNIMLLARAARSAAGRYKPLVRLVDTKVEIVLLDSGNWTVRNARGDCLSVVPLSESIALTCRGTDYDVTGLRILRGETVGLRNRVRAARASMAVRGQALVFHEFSGR